MSTQDPEVQAGQAALAEATAKLAALDAQIEALSDAARDKRGTLRTAFREAHSRRFADVDYKRALVGAKSEHAVTIPGVVSLFIRPPTAGVTHAVDKFISEPTVPDAVDATKAINMGPVSEAERMLLAWLVGVHLLADAGAKRQEVEGLAPGRRLQMLRGLPEDLIRRVAEEAGLLQSWLNVTLEIELGNF
jgi:hypothetical protein